MSTNTFQIIDEAAQKFYTTKDKKYFNTFAKVASPLIKAQARSVCAGSVRWDAEELFSILFADMWRLFNVYIPEKDKQFHWLMRRQLKNKTINYIHNTTGKTYKICFSCNTAQPTQEKKASKRNNCIKCGTTLHKPHAATGCEDLPIFSGSYCPDYLSDLNNKQMIEKLLNSTKDSNPVTHKILIMFLEGYTKTEISKEVKIAQNAINYRLEKCQQYIGDFI